MLSVPAVTGCDEGREVPVQNSLIYVVFWLLVTTGCTWRFAQFGMDKPSGPSLCAEVLDWESASASQALRMTP